MKNVTTTAELSHPTTDSNSHLFDDRFDPIESGSHTRAAGPVGRVGTGRSEPGSGAGVGELHIVAGRRVDEPAVAGRVVVDRDVTGSECTQPVRRNVAYGCTSRAAEPRAEPPTLPRLPNAKPTDI
jgi:hypothetical protein